MIFGGEDISFGAEIGEPGGGMARLGAIFEEWRMREVQKRQFQFGQVAIEDIWLDPKSRDDIPAVLKGLQHLHKERREELFSLLERHIRPGTDRKVGRPGMDLWRILVLGVLKQGLGCDFDRLHDLANNHRTVRAMLAHGDFADGSRYEMQTLIDNVSLLTPELLSAVGQLVVASGHAVAGKKPGEPLRGRCDSFAVETDVHYPTDVNLLWDAMRCLIRETARLAKRREVGGWRQWRHWSGCVRTLFHRVRSTRRAKGRPEWVEAYLARCGELVERVEGTLGALAGKGVPESEWAVIRGYVGHARRQMDQVKRRLLKGETIPHEEKVFSIFEEHTRWVSKGKAGTPVELGVPVCVMEDQFQFILHHKILWAGGDVDLAAPMVEETQALSPERGVFWQTLLSFWFCPGHWKGRAARSFLGRFVLATPNHWPIDGFVGAKQEGLVDVARFWETKLTEVIVNNFWSQRALVGVNDKN